MGQKWLLKSEPDVWSIDQQKKSWHQRCTTKCLEKLSGSKKFKKC